MTMTDHRKWENRYRYFFVKKFLGSRTTFPIYCGDINSDGWLDIDKSGEAPNNFLIFGNHFQFLRKSENNL